MDFCELFPKFQSAATLAVWKSLYCERKFQDCARYKRSLEGRSAPIDLLPDGTSLTGATGER